MVNFKERESRKSGLGHINYINEKESYFKKKLVKARERGEGSGRKE